MKGRSLSAFEDHAYMEMMNKHLLGAREKFILKHALIALSCGVGFMLIWKYITSDTDLSFTQFYRERSSFLQQLWNGFSNEKDMFQTIVDKNKNMVDDDGNLNHIAYSAQSNVLYDHKLDASHALPPSLAPKRAAAG